MLWLANKRDCWAGQTYAIIPFGPCTPTLELQAATCRTPCTVRLFAPGRCQQNAHWIWSSLVIAIRNVGYMGYSMSHSHSSTMQVQPLRDYLLPYFSRALQRPAVRTQPGPKPIVTSPVRIFNTMVIKVSFGRQWYYFLRCDAMQSGRSSPTFVCCLILVGYLLGLFFEWGWRQYVPPKARWAFVGLHVVIPRG
jgi:hypothetical protein